MRRIVAAAAMAAALAFPLGVLASHTFSDVPASNTFHADIEALAASGVTTGCGPATYCPKEFVTREQMAAFLNRLGALGPGKTPVVHATLLDGLDASQFARSDVARVGHAGCSGAEMFPAVPGYPYIVAGEGIFNDGGQSATFFCPISLPDGATVTALRARLRDTTITAQTSCSLKRVALLETASMVSMATVDSSVLGAPNQVVVEDLTIDSPIVDNGASEYVGRCQLGAGLQHTGVYAFSVEYTLTGLP